MTKIRCPLNETARISPNQFGLAAPGNSFLYTELEQCVEGAARLLEKDGVRCGERVGLCLPGSWEQVVAFWALLRLGATVCPLASPSETGRAASALGVQRLISRDPPGSSPLPEWLDVKKYIGFTAPFVKNYRPTLELDREALILWSRDQSPVPVIHSVGSCYYAALAGNATLPLRSKSRWLLRPLDGFEGVDILFRCALAGAVVAVSDDNPSADGAVLETLEVTHHTLYPDEIRSFLADADANDRPVTHLLLAGAASRAELDALLHNGRSVVMTLGCQSTGYFATLDRQGRMLGMKFASLRRAPDGRIEVSGKTLAGSHLVSRHARAPVWMPTSWKALEQNGAMYYPIPDGTPP